MMNKQDIYDLLSGRGFWHEITEHPAVYNMAEMAEVQLPYPEADAKNLFIRDDKRQTYCLITVRGDKRVDLKRFRKEQGLRPLHFAPAEELQALLSLTPGSVTPFGLLNDADHRVTLYLDGEFSGALIGVHPNDNTATVWLQAEDLVRLLMQRGTSIQFVTLPVMDT